MEEGKRGRRLEMAVKNAGQFTQRLFEVAACLKDNNGKGCDEKFPFPVLFSLLFFRELHRAIVAKFHVN